MQLVSEVGVHAPTRICFAEVSHTLQSVHSVLLAAVLKFCPGMQGSHFASAVAVHSLTRFCPGIDRVAKTNLFSDGCCSRHRMFVNDTWFC